MKSSTHNCPACNNTHLFISQIVGKTGGAICQSCNNWFAWEQIARWEQRIGISQAAAAMGRKGGKATGPAKARSDAKASASVPRTALGSRRNPRHYTTLAEAQLFADGIAAPLWCKIGTSVVLVKPQEVK